MKDYVAQDWFKAFVGITWFVALALSVIWTIFTLGNIWAANHDWDCAKHGGVPNVQTSIYSTTYFRCADGYQP